MFKFPQPTSFCYDLRLVIVNFILLFLALKFLCSQGEGLGLYRIAHLASRSSEEVSFCLFFHRSCLGFMRLRQDDLFGDHPQRCFSSRRHGRQLRPIILLHACCRPFIFSQPLVVGRLFDYSTFFNSVYIRRFTLLTRILHLHTVRRVASFA